MKRALLAVFACTAFLLIPSAVGAKPSTSASISVAPGTVTFGSATTITGVVTGKKAAGATVRLVASPFPYTTSSTVATTTASSTGHYSFTIKPGSSTRYHVRANVSPQATSTAVQVKVRVKVTIGVGTLTPKAGAKVRFFGSVRPAFNGKSVLIQRRTATGHWNTVAHATLVATTSTTRSKYSKRVKVGKSGTYRVRFVPPNGAYLANNSGTRHLTTH
jgi:hypothetical protein